MPRAERDAYARADRWVTAYARAVIRFRGLVLALCAATAAAAITGVGELRFRSDYRYFFGPDNPELAAFDAIENTYTKTDNILFVLAPQGGDVFTPDTLRAVARLTEQGWQVPYSIRVDSITNFQHTRASQDDLIVEDLVANPERLTAEGAARVRAIALAEPVLAGKLVARNGAATAVVVTLQMPEGEGVDTGATVAFARQLVAELEREHPDLEVALTGSNPMDQAFPEATQRDLTTLVPFMYAALALTMLLFLRSVWGTLATISVIALAATSAMGLGGWLGIPLTPVAAVAPTIILTIAIADGVHILVTLTRDLRAGQDKYEAIVDSLRVNWQPVFLTSLTTVIGFLALNFSDAPPFADLGNLTALGVVAAWFYSVTFLPAFVAIVPYRVRPARRLGHGSLERFAEWLITWRSQVLIAMAGLVLATGLLIPRIELNDSFVEFFDPAIEFRRDTDFTSRHLSGIYQIEYSVGAGEEGAISEPEYLAGLERFADWYRAQPHVDHVLTLSDTMKRLNKNLHGDVESMYRLPDARDLAAQYLLLYEMSLPYGLDLNNQINVKKSATKLSVTLQNVSARELREADRRARAWLRQNLPPAMHAEGAGMTLMFAHISERNIESMLRGTVLAFALISLTLALALRSVKLGLLSLVPNLVPTVIAFGIWGGLIGEVGMAVATVTACSLGIIVDATVHFLSKYLRARRERGASSEDAVRYAIATVGAALWITFAILAVGFGILGLSSFQMNAHFGLLVAITIAAALAADFLLLPTLLMRIEGALHQEEPQYATT